MASTPSPTPPWARVGHETDVDGSEEAEAPADDGGFQTSARRPWWLRWLGG